MPWRWRQLSACCRRAADEHQKLEKNIRLFYRFMDLEPSTTTDREVEIRYRRLAVALHPDKELRSQILGDNWLAVFMGLDYQSRLRATGGRFWYAPGERMLPLEDLPHAMGFEIEDPEGSVASP